MAAGSTITALEYFSEDLLKPIADGAPSGVDLRYEPLFAQITEARRADDDLNEGEWQKEGGRKSAEWNRVAELCLEAIRSRSKDLRLSAYLTEAAVRLDGFAGLRDGLRLTTELLQRFWDKGLFPSVEDNDLEYRAGALNWLNDLLPQVSGRTLITARPSGENYGYLRYLQAQRVGTEAAAATASAKIRETIRDLIGQGWITMDQFNAALGGTSLKALEAIYEPFDQADQALTELEKVADERFGKDAPSFSPTREMMSEVRKILAPAIRSKREQERGGDPPARPPNSAARISFHFDVSTANDGKVWNEAEALVGAGKVDEGLQQMAAAAADEPSGRGRFVRKLRLADVCLANRRDRLARTVLEELNQQIDEFRLAQWESSSLVGAVWSRLYRIYRGTDDSDDRNNATKLYNQLARLDPWQAYVSCED
jgi:type VI secretion system protein ImpA